MTTEPRWYRSSYSNNGGNCVEVALDWHKSSYSDNGGDCVEVGVGFPARGEAVPVRDSKNLDGPVLGFSVDAFAAFVADVKARGAGTH
ncbi:DUF397 domain-containing protein [Streptomyces sp. PvR034]|uniref:DUF397 domain-containing protein n=1 Tax=Streptomyces sp. PvR034 TaxID=3156401 RepID=UPI003395B105